MRLWDLKASYQVKAMRTWSRPRPMGKRASIMPSAWKYLRDGQAVVGLGCVACAAAVSCCPQGLWQETKAVAAAGMA